MRILVVDDHEVVRRGICSVLAGDPAFLVCGEAVDGHDAVEKALVMRPDVVVMDISMPKLNGLEATRKIKRILPESEIVIVSQHDSQEMIRQAFNAGALGYVVKSAISDDLLAALKKASQHQSFVSSVGSAGTNENLDAQEIFQRNARFEEALRESEERFRSAMSNMAEGLYTVDCQDLVTYINPSAETMFGWASNELLGKKMHDITHYKHPDGSPYPASDCPVLQVIEKGLELREREEVFLRRDGSLFPVVFSASPLRSDGKIVGVVVGFRDDTKRREAEEVLRRSPARFQLVADTVTMGLARLGRDLRYSWVNRHYAEWIGRPVKEIAGQPIIDVLGKEAFEGLEQYFRRVLDGESVAYEKEVNFKGIGRRWISAAYTPTFDSAGVDGWVASVADISDRKKRDAELARQAGLLDLSFNAVIVRDADDRIIYWNKAAEEFYGWTREEALGQVTHTLFQTKFAEPLDSIFARIRSEGLWQGELAHTRKNGDKIKVLSRWALMRDPHTNSESILEANTDITQIKETEQALHRLVETLEDRVSERTRELENATEKLRELSGRLLQTQDQERRRIARELHDGVGQLIAAMSMNLSKLGTQKDRLTSEGRECLQENASLIAQASQEIRTMSHLLHPPLLDEVGLESALRWFVDGFSERSNITVSLELVRDFSDALPRDLALALFRIVQECLTNVHRHSGSPTAIVKIGGSSAEITLEVQDEGRGIPAEIQSKIASGQSYGVGLRGMRERVRQFSGRVEVLSGQNGTRIVVVLPIAEAAEVEEEIILEPESQADGGNGSPKKTLR